MRLSSIYARQPNEFKNGIPIFSATDEYTENYRKIAEDHIDLQTPDEPNPFMEQELWAELEQSTRSLIENYVPSNATILDAGVGLGRLIEPLDAYQRYGVDISLKYLQKSREHGIEVSYCRIEQLPYHDSSFDAVIACDVLEHVLDLNRSTEEMLRVLKPGGLLVLRVPYKEDLDVYLRDDLDYKFIHLRNFDFPSLKLHFCKIFGMDYVTHNTVAPHLQGSSRLRLRLLREGDPILELLDSISWWEILHPLYLLKWLSILKEKKFESWIYRLRDKHRSWYDKVASSIVFNFEINIVLRKNAGDKE